MKILKTAIVAIALLIPFSISAQSVESLWKDYRKAEDSDKPKTQLEILGKIKTVAASRQLPWDYYDAATKCYSVGTRMNWRLRDSLSRNLRGEILQYDLPLMVVRYLTEWEYAQTDSLLAYISSNRSRMLGGTTSASPMLGEDARFANDYESALATVVRDRRDKTASSLLLEEVKGRRELEAWAEYGVVEYRKEALEALVKKYAGTSSAYRAQLDVLYIRLSEMEQNKAGQQEYMALRDDAKALTKHCKDAQMLVDHLESKGVDASAKDRVLELRVRNVRNLKLTMLSSSGKEVWKTTVDNPKNSFYVADTLKIAIPDVSDGEYQFRFDYGQKEERSLYYEQYTLSAAYGVVESGLYVAHYLSGKPLEGFTTQKRDNGCVRARLENADGTVWLSKDVSTRMPQRTIMHKEPTGTILTDCAAYHPGDTLKYKIVAFDTDRTMAEGTKVTLVIRDAEGKVFHTAPHRLNAFGSAWGSLVLERAGRNGNFSLELKHGETQIAYSSIYVGEYVLPTFEITLKPQSSYCFEGDTVRFEGRVDSYSGRRLSVLSAVCRINGSFDGAYTTRQQSFSVAPDGSFSVDVVGASGYVSATFDITDSTGETKSVRGSMRVCKCPDIRVDYPDAHNGTLGDNNLRINFSTSYPVDEIRYRILDSSSRIVESGIASPGENTFTLPRESALYRVEAESMHRGIESQKHSTELAVVLPGATSFADRLESFVLPREGMSCQFGSTTSDIWAVVGLYSSAGKLIENRFVHVTGEKGVEGSVKTVSFERPASIHGPLSISVFWFRDADSMFWTHTFESEEMPQRIPLSFTSFTDKTSPSVKTTFSIRTDKGSEVAVSVYDKSADVIRKLFWRTVQPYGNDVAEPVFSASAGFSGSGWRGFFRPMMKSASVSLMADSFAENGVFVEEESVLIGASSDASFEEVAEVDDSDVNVRSVLLDAIAFDPALYPDKNGDLSYSFIPSGKLSTYHVKVYAHSKERNSACIEKDVTVFLPLEVSLAVPAFLYAGDRYSLRASVSSDSSSAVRDGWLTLVAFDAPDGKGEELLRQTVRLELDNGVATHVFDQLDVPSCASGSISFRLTFVADNADGNRVSDGVLVGCPVYPARKTMHEAHSGLLLSGMGRDALVAQMRGEFTNLPSEGATLSERRIADLLSDVFDPDRQPRWDDAVSLMEAIAVRSLSSSAPVVDTLVTRLLALRREDGGFSWRAEMPSSAYVTAYVLSAAADLRYRGCLPSALGDLSSSVRFLDAAYFNPQKIWYSLPEDLYCQVRSQYAEVKLVEKTGASKRAALKKYLTHKDDKYYTGAVMLKARRVLSIDALTSSEEGLALAKAWGLKLFTSSRLASTVRKDVASLSEYAQKHPSGGIFFPNAVMPFRGLLESELSAHVLLIRVFESRDASIAEGVRLWIMLQKETQKWERDPECVLACAAVMDGSPALLDTRILTLTATAEQPFGEVKAASNGMKVATRWMVQSGSGWEPLEDGDSLSVGQKVRGEYTMYSDQNRSFVMFEAPRPACFQPLDQKSGYQWFNMYGLYRDVRRECSQYWFDVLPEDSYTIVEDFAVSQTGVFQSPAAELQCLYAPHWMANEDARPLLELR